MKKQFTLFLILFFATATLAFSQSEARLMRFPAISGDKVVFTYAGDLYTVSTAGGLARKLTSYADGYEMFARFSPDGKWLAFTGQYDGNTEVYTMPAEGGTPQRVTYTATLHRDDVSDRMGPNNVVMTWSPDSKNIVYRSRRYSFNDFRGQLFSVPREGGMSAEIPLQNGGFCNYNADGSKLAFNRVFREFRTWKYYKGGMADDVWIFDTSTKTTENITNNVSQDIFPMWCGDIVYFLSDRDRTMNLFAYNTKTKETKKVTNFTEYDIKFPTIGGDKIVFENAGYLYVFDCKTQTQQKLSIVISDDFLSSRNVWKDANKNIENTSLSPNGERFLLTARGEIFSIPAKQGITKNLSQSSGSHECHAEWSPDGKTIAFISDMSGEFEIYTQKADGSEKPVQITKNTDTYKFSINWSPDSKKIAWSDRMFRLQFVDVDSKQVTKVDSAENEWFRNFEWSSDSKWLVYTKPTRLLSQIYLYSIDSKSITELSENWFESENATFSTDGKYVVFTSDRDFTPIYNDVEWNYDYQDMAKIYMITLSKSTPSPFALENDEVKNEVPVVEDNKTKDNKGKDAKKTEPVSTNIKVDLDGIKDRLIALPIESGNYWNITAIDDKVYYNHIGLGKEISLKMYDLKQKKESIIGKKMFIQVSSNGKKALIIRVKEYFMLDLPTSELNLSESIDLSEVKVLVDNQLEWTQIYNEAWRQMRDFFYVPNMHGVDWKKIQQKYAVLLPHVKNRIDLSYVIGEMIGELNVGHAYIGGGDCPKPERIAMGLLGAKLSKDASGYFKIDKILEGENWWEKTRSPLTEVGVNVKVGEYITAINGISTKNVSDIYSLLVGQADLTVELSVSSMPSEIGSRKVLVKPIADESGLYYNQWVENNIRKVSEATNGQVGYIHIPDMGPDGLNEFVKHYYPQLSKKALIVDDRGNGGGNVSPMILERLQREVYRIKARRGVGFGMPTPDATLIGPKVCLMDNYSASDGDQFPWGFQQLKLGKVIGKRSWGGVVGIWGSLPFVDGTDLRKPESASYSPVTGQWIIEGYGVDPDIEIDNDPYKEFMGIEDAQLNKAIEVILDEMKSFNFKIPAVPAAPDKSK